MTAFPNGSNSGFVTSNAPPTVGGSSGAWGTTLNAMFAEIVAWAQAMVTSVGGALAITGGSLTGLVNLHTESLLVDALGNVSGTKNLDLSAYQSYTLTITGDSIITLSNPPTGTSAILLQIINGNSHAITWPSGTKWPGGSPAALSTSGKDVVVLVTFDSGSTWDAFLCGKGLA